MTNGTPSAKTSSFRFNIGSQDEEMECEWLSESSDNENEAGLHNVDKVRQSIGRALNARYVAFLFGAGCSSFVNDKKVEVGISTMVPLAKKFKSKWNSGKAFLSTEETNFVKRHSIDIDETRISNNIERLMQFLFSLRFTIDHQSGKPKQDIVIIDGIINKVQEFIFCECTKGEFSKGDNTVLSVYDSFYRKLMLRDRSLPAPWIFTTNYDLFNERAMDRIGLLYGNGFSGVVERRFNPATFRYSVAEQFDLRNRKWATVSGFVHLCKLHGSVSWIEDDHGLFPILENPNIKKISKSNRAMIYPTPAKQDASLGSPYADLFREFQSRVVREQSVLFVMGYAFGDSHINNIIYQALTFPTFRLVVFADPDKSTEVNKLRNLNDPRVWIIWGKGPPMGKPAHYFSTIVEQFLPQKPKERINEAVSRVARDMPRKDGDLV